MLTIPEYNLFFNIKAIIKCRRISKLVCSAVVYPPPPYQRTGQAFAGHKGSALRSLNLLFLCAFRVSAANYFLLSAIPCDLSVVNYCNNSFSSLCPFSARLSFASSRMRVNAFTLSTSTCWPERWYMVWRFISAFAV